MLLWSSISKKLTKWHFFDHFTAKLTSIDVKYRLLTENWHPMHSFTSNIDKTTLKTIKKWYCGHLFLKNWQNDTFSIILHQDWRPLTSKIGFWPKIDIQCTHWHQISIKNTIKTIEKCYCGHLYQTNWQTGTFSIILQQIWH